MFNSSLSAAALAATLFVPVQTSAQLDLVTQFRATACQYGHTEKPGGVLTEFARQDAVSVRNVLALQRSGSYPAQGPFLAINVGSTAATLPFGPFPPNTLHLRAGAKGEHSVVRCAVPVPDSFRVTGEFIGLDGNSATIYVLVNDTAAFESVVSSKGKAVPFEVTRLLAAGDRISFVVGPAPGGAGVPGNVGLRGKIDLAPPPSTSSFRDARQALQAKDYAAAHRILREQAERGDATAQYNLGVLFFDGAGTAKDPKEALRWWSLAAEQGHAAAQHNIGVLYKDGNGVKQDDREAFRWFLKAADRGMDIAQMKVGAAYEEGLGVPLNKPEAYRWLSLASRSLLPASLSLTLLQGEGGVYEERHKAASLDDPDEERLQSRLSGDASLNAARAAFDSQKYEQALRLFQNAAEGGNALAAHYVGRMHAWGRGVPEEDDRAAYGWYRKAAAQGLDFAEERVASSLQHGVGTEKNAAEAMQWYLKAAEHGNREAQFQLGELYREQRNFHQAAVWFRRAAERGHPRAAWGLAECLKAGAAASAEAQAERLKWIRFAADSFVGEAQAELAERHTWGDGVPKDAAAAFSWAQRASDEGVARARRLLGHMYLNGLGTKRDVDEAVRFFRLAAEEEDAEAENQLGLMYLRGEGLPLDLAHGLRWSWKAAAHGATKALLDAAAVIERSEKLTSHASPQELKLAAWTMYDVASRLGVSGATNERDRIAAALPAEAIAQAKRMADEMLTTLRSR